MSSLPPLHRLLAAGAVLALVAGPWLAPAAAAGAGCTMASAEACPLSGGCPLMAREAESCGGCPLSAPAAPAHDAPGPGICDCAGAPAAPAAAPTAAEAGADAVPATPRVGEAAAATCGAGAGLAPVAPAAAGPPLYALHGSYLN